MCSDDEDGRWEVLGAVLQEIELVFDDNLGEPSFFVPFDDKPISWSANRGRALIISLVIFEIFSEFLFFDLFFIVKLWDILLLVGIKLSFLISILIN